MDATPIKTGLCAFGMSGKIFHAPFIQANEGFELYGVVERSNKSAAQVYPRVRSFRSLEEMLADKNIELVIVNTPNATHYDFAGKALLSGKHVIVEKPFVVSVLEGAELIQLAAQKQLLISVYQNRRWDSDFQLVQKIVDEKLLGDIVEVEIHYDRFKLELSSKAQKETAVPGAGLLYDLGPHLIDQALVLFGKPQAVFADLAAMRPLSLVEDYFEVLLYYDKLRVRLRAGLIIHAPLPAYILHGTKGSFTKTRADVQENDLAGGKPVSSEDWGIEPEDQKGKLTAAFDGQPVVKYLSAPAGNYMEYFTGIYNAIRLGNPAPVSAVEALEVIKVIEAAFQSNAAGRKITYEGV